MPFFLVLWMVVLWLPVVYAQPAKSKAPLNIILVTADDLGLQLGCYGDNIAHTPNLDAFARKGMLFRNAYVTQASCSPSRSSMLTGLYPHQNGQVGLSHRGYEMFDRIQTLPKLLKGQGYVNAIIGKLHVEPEAHFPFDYANKDARKTWDVADVAAQAKTFMDTVNAPFFLMVNYFDPHVEMPPQVKGIPAKPYTSKDVKAFSFQHIGTDKELKRIADYYSCVERLDTGFGMLMQALAKSGKESNTLVIFLGDHGPPFVRAKTNCYEAGLKVPFLAYWPNKPAGEFAGFINSNDILPTALEAAQVPVPQNLPGNTLKPVFEKKEFVNRPYVFGEFTAHAPQLFYPMRSVRDNRYKLIINYLADKPFPSTTVDGDMAWKESQLPEFEGTQIRKVFNRYVNRPLFELYDLTKDPEEFEDLAQNSKYQPIIDRLKKALLEWQKETHDPLLYSVNLAQMVKVHQEILEKSRENPDYKPHSPILWTDY